MNQRINRTHFKKIVRELYPDFFSLPSVHYHHNSLIGLLERTFSGIERIFDKCKLGQEIVLSPFKYEHHEKNLINYLSMQVVAGGVKISEVFDCDIPEIIFPSWRRSSIKEYYRLCTMDCILKPESSEKP